MNDKINANKIKVSSFSAELPSTLQREKRLFVTIEADIISEDYPTNDDGTYDRVYKAKLVGSTIVKQDGVKDTYVCKSKRSPSKRLRAAFWHVNPDENFYEVYMDKLVNNLEDVVEFLKNK